jgi:hypothetical protein
MMLNAAANTVKTDKTISVKAEQDAGADEIETPMPLASIPQNMMKLPCDGTSLQVPEGNF